MTPQPPARTALRALSRAQPNTAKGKKSVKSDKDLVHAGKRRFLRNAAASTAGLTAMSMFPPAIRRALAIPANNRTGTINDVEHVVILMQENRSFDMYFGTYKGVRGFGDRITIPLPQNRSVWEQHNGTRVVMPYHLDSKQGNAQRVSGTPHDYMDAQQAWDGMYQWPRYKQNQSMGYEQQEVEFQYALAEAFTLCDAYHCSTHGGTNTNRLFHWTGTNDPLAMSNGPSTRNQWDSMGASSTGWSWKTYPERLQENGVTWKVYQNLPDNFTTRWPASSSSAAPTSWRAINARGRRRWTRPILYKGVANTMPDGGFLKALRDVRSTARCRRVSWIVAPASYSEHPGPSSPVQGAWYIQETLDALTANPDVWSKTVLLINFDENDGYFDHVPPPAAPSLDTADGTLPAGAVSGALAGASTVNTDLSRPCRRSRCPIPACRAAAATGVRYSRLALRAARQLPRAVRSAVGLVFANTADFPKMSVPASVFHVYDKLHLDRIPRRYTVEPGKQLEGWDAAGRRQVRSVGDGPQRFCGISPATWLARTAQLDAEIRVLRHRQRRCLRQVHEQWRRAPCTFVVTPNAYYVNHERWTLTVPAGGQVEQAWRWPTATPGTTSASR